MLANLLVVNINIRFKGGKGNSSIELRDLYNFSTIITPDARYVSPKACLFEARFLVRICKLRKIRFETLKYPYLYKFISCAKLYLLQRSSERILPLLAIPTAFVFSGLLIRMRCYFWELPKSSFHPSVIELRIPVRLFVGQY